MPKHVRHILLFAAWALLLSSAWCADTKQHEPGGKGILSSRMYIDECFKTSSGTVTEICGNYKISWKLWALMGEPVGDYKLTWTLSSITLMDPKRKTANNFTPYTLPAELKKPARAIELYIDAYATVNTSTDIYHHFDTGTAVRAGAGSSFNVPGSPSWDTVFHKGIPPCEPLSTIFVGVISKQKTYLDAKAAKDLFKQGIQLNSLVLCKESGVSELTSLESAIGKMCEKPGADKRYKFCPKTEEKPKKEEQKGKSNVADKDKNKDKSKDSGTKLAESILDGDNNSSSLNVQSVLDESTESSAIKKRLSQEVAAYRLSAEPACQNTIRDIDACYAKTGCKRVDPSPSIEECRRIPPYPGKLHCNPFCLTKVPQPGDVCYNDDAECRAAKARAEREEAREAEELRRNQHDWESRYRTLNDECQQRSKEREIFASCQRQFDSTCNPKHFNSTSDCLDEQVRTKGPTEKDARKLMKKTWEDRSKNGSSIRNSILD